MALAAETLVATRSGDPGLAGLGASATDQRIRDRDTHGTPTVEHRVGCHDPREPTLGLVRQQSPRLAGAGGVGGGRRSGQCPAWFLGGARDAVGAAHERRVDGIDRAASAGRNRDRIRDRRSAPAGDRQRLHRAVGRASDRRAGRGAMPPARRRSPSGQAAFTVTVAVLFNLLVPVGWKVGVVRIEDVALGCAVSVLAGTLLWPRGVSALVGDDLADVFRSGRLLPVPGRGLGDRSASHRARRRGHRSGTAADASRRRAARAHGRAGNQAPGSYRSCGG